MIRKTLFPPRVQDILRPPVIFMKPYYQDENTTIYLGDCREVLPQLKDEIHLTLTDPPYNVGLNYSDGDNRDDYETWTQEWFELCPQPFVVTPGMVNLTMWLKMQPPTWTCAWFKPNQCSPSALGGFNIWEPVLVYGKPKKRIGQDGWLYSIAQQREANGHPCPKFLPFWTKLLSSFLEEGQTVLDPFLGSGTTLKAARQLGCKAIGIEIEERYCQIAIEHLAQRTLEFTEAV